MSQKIKIQGFITPEILKKLESVERIPRREWHKNNVPNYYGDFITRYTETTEFKIRQQAAEHMKQMLTKESELRTARSEASNARFHLSMKNVEIESLKKQLEQLKPKAA
jgi:hypothetical protein